MLTKFRTIILYPFSINPSYALHPSVYILEPSNILPCIIDNNSFLVALFIIFKYTLSSLFNTPNTIVLPIAPLPLFPLILFAPK